MAASPWWKAGWSRWKAEWPRLPAPAPGSAKFLPQTSRGGRPPPAPPGGATPHPLFAAARWTADGGRALSDSVLFPEEPRAAVAWSGRRPAPALPARDVRARTAGPSGAGDSVLAPAPAAAS